MLFPILDYTAEAQHQLGIRVDKLEQDVVHIKTIVEEMHSLQKEQLANCFNLKEAGYSVCMIFYYGSSCAARNHSCACTCVTCQ